MFTGLVQETGVIEDVRRLKARNGDVVTRIRVSAKSIPKELKLGDSVAVSGVCLTAVEIGRRKFSADLADETLKRTSLNRLKKKSLVNLELPARPQDRLGGHIVQGHVDGTGTLVALTKIKGRDDWRMMIDMPPELARYVVAQGSITVEGISLTVAAIEGHRVEIAIIPPTYEQTNLRDLHAGAPLNLEVDVLAKYVEKLTQKTPPTTAALHVAGLVRRGF
jgi:riboflavin synthase